jgi:prepilin-type N-terminal cleavage/methylation domain-containing protein
LEIPHPKTIMKLKNDRRNAFTLIELLVVITIIGILATLAPSAIAMMLEAADRTKAISNARNIYLGLRGYSRDHEGMFPTGETAAAAFSKLLAQEEGAQGYIPGNKEFKVKGSAWTRTRAEAGEGERGKLGEGENHWGYMANLNDADNARWPLVFDGPASADGKYSAKRSEKGGVWSGKVAIVVRVSGEAKEEPLEGLTIKTDGQQNVLRASENWLNEGKLLMPY